MSSNTRLFLIYVIAAVLSAAILLLFASSYVRTGHANLLILGLALALVGLLAGVAVQRLVLRPAQQQVAEALRRGQEELELRVAERTEALLRNAERLGILHEIDQSLLAAHRAEDIALAAIGRLRRLVPYQHALVTTAEQDGQARVLASQSGGGLPAASEPNGSLEALYGELLHEPALLQGRIYGVADLAALPHRSPLQQTLYQRGVREVIVVPLMVGDELVGSLNLESSVARSFTADHVTIAREVGTSLAVAIRQARLVAQLQQELEERLQAEAVLQRRTETLQARNAELDAFAHTVAHDLKNPLAAILGYCNVLSQHRQQMGEEKLEHFAGIIDRNARKINSIVDELLLLASVRDRDDIEMAPLDMARIVAGARDRLQFLASELGAEIQAPEEWPASLGHAPWVEEVWANYISNALKYGGRPPRVELGYTLPQDRTQTRGRVIRYWVRDDGPGLTPQQQAALFTPFERLHQVRVGGYGLGLSIVQRIVHKLGGQVGVESSGQEGRGSTFYFTLPAALDGDT